MNNKLVSIIVPVYNVEQYLNKCVHSLVNQTYKNLEIILVDDGSPDNCPKMCDDWAKKDNRIKVIHKSNGGQSEARNIALDAAKGEYISFVDSDDYVDNTFIEKLLNSAITNNSDFVQCDFNIVKNNNITKRTNQQLKYITAKKIFEHHVYDYYFTKNNQMIVDSFSINVWSNLYSKKLIGKVRFEKNALGEDLIFNCDVLKENTKVSAVDECLYFYLIREGSTMATFDEERIKKRLKFTLASMPRMKNKVCNETFDAYKFLCFKQVSLDLIHIKDKKIYAKYMQELKSLNLNTRQNYKSYIKNLKTFKTKVLTFLVHHKCFALIKLLWRIMKFLKRKK